MNKIIKADVASLSQYMRDYLDNVGGDYQARFTDALEERSGIVPALGVDVATWQERIDAFDEMHASDSDYQGELDWLRLHSDGHPECVLARLKRNVVDAPEDPVHPDAGLGLFVVSGRVAGDDDDTVSTYVAASEESAVELFREDRIAEEEGRINAPSPEGIEVIVVSTTLIGVHDRDGRLNVGARLPEPCREVQAVEPVPEWDDGPSCM
ncbi:hypothetical protein [Geopseudomonas aromaticivorans]